MIKPEEKRVGKKCHTPTETNLPWWAGGDYHKYFYQKRLSDVATIYAVASNTLTCLNNYTAI